MWSDFQIDFGMKEIEILNYPYPSSSITHRASLKSMEIDEVDPAKDFPEIRLKTGEILFIPAFLRKKLKKFARRNQIPVINRIDIWGLILEPFLDTELSGEHKKKTIKTLQRQGISPETVAEIRTQINDVMIAYNFDSMLWESHHLGLPDLLDALMGRLAGKRFQLGPEEFREFYSRAMEIAGQAKPT